MRAKLLSANRFLFLTFTVLTLCTSLTACTEKRPQVFTQGQGSNLDSIAAWKAKFYNIETGGVIGTSPSTNAQDGVRIADSVDTMNHLDLVKLKIADEKLRELVKSPPFHARPNTKGTYQLLVKLTDNYLKVYTVAQPKDLPFEEHFYKEETFPDGRIAIPLLGYKIKGFYRVEAEKTSDDQESHHLVEIEVDDIANATHVRIDWATRELFEAVQKIDLFPAEIFFAIDEKTKAFKPYEWYYAETVTEKSLSDNNTRVGDVNGRSEYSKLSPATKVMFIPREGELRVVNIARDERLSRDQIQTTADLNSEATMIIPVNWTDYRTKADGTASSMKGEKVRERKWSERRYFEANFPQTESASIANGTNRLVDIEVDQNYFSFTVLNMNGNKGRKILYSFLRADKDRLPYAAKRSFKDDRNTFGFFSTTKPFYANWEYYTQEDYSKREFMSRINPAAKEIVFNLSTASPKHLRAVTEKAIQAWDKAFQEALSGTGRSIRVRLAQEPAQLGDLRHNIIHLVDTLNEDGLLGFGPSVSDPETGEIIAATTNIYVNSFQAIASSTVRQYIINRLEGNLDFDKKEEPKKQTVADPAALLNQLLGGSDQPRNKRQIELLNQATKLAKQDLRFDDSKLADALKIDDQAEAQLRKEGMSARCQYANNIAITTSDREIKKHCGKVEEIVAKYKGVDLRTRANGARNWEQIWSDSKEAIADCSKKITEEKLLSTIIHEVGHNLGLRHNFYGSVDKANFKEVTSSFGEKITAESSSIMEYTVWEEDRLPEAGKYDVAAIRFGYGDSVEQNNGTLISIPNDKSINDTITALKKSKSDLKSYLFCTDEEAYFSFNAMCRPSDSGTTPLEVVQYYSKLYERLQEIRRFRRVRPDIMTSEALGADTAARIFIPMKEIYDQWRHHLGEYVRKSNRYLSDLTPETYKATLSQMKSDKVYGPIYAEYYDAANKVYEFFRDIAFSDNQYCLIEGTDGKRAIEFDRLRDLLSESSRGNLRIRNCADAADAAELAAVLGEKTVKISGETGYPLNGYRFEAPETVYDSVVDDVVGNQMTRAYAGLMLTYRNASTLKNITNRFLPNMLDEPNHFVEIAQKSIERIVKGVNLKSVGVKNFIPLFESEAVLYTQFMQLFRNGLLIPTTNADGTDIAASRSRLQQFSVYRPEPGTTAAQWAAVLVLNDRPMFAAISKNYVLAYNLIQTYNQVEQMLAMKSVPEATLKDVVPFYKKVLPTNAAVTTMKVEAFVMLYDAIQKFSAEKKASSLLSCMSSGVKELAQLEKIFAALAEDFGKLTSEDEVKKFIAQSATEYMKARLNEEYVVTQENMSQYDAAVTACSTQINEAVRLINKNRKDYASQKTLILNVLNAFAE